MTARTRGGDGGRSGRAEDPATSSRTGSEPGTEAGTKVGTEGGFSDEDYGAILAFRDQLRRFLAWSDAQARAAGLTAGQHQMLLAVRGHPGVDPPTIGEIAGHLQIRHHSVVGLVDRAEEAGLVRRRVDSRDRRVMRVELTPAGENVLERLTTLHLSELNALKEAGGLPHPPVRRSLVDPRGQCGGDDLGPG